MRLPGAGIGVMGREQTLRRPLPHAAGAGLLLLPLIAWLLGPRDRTTLALLVFAPFVEEAIFRAGLQEALLGMGRSALAANAWTALTFGLAHAAVRGQASAFLVAAPALLVGALYARWGRLRLCIGAHALMNAGWLAWAHFGAASPVGP